MRKLYYRFLYWLFMLNGHNSMALEVLKACPCGTLGSCENCVGTNEYLWWRWTAITQPLRYFWKVKILCKPW
jgi:hypothetical protein